MIIALFLIIAGFVIQVFSLLTNILGFLVPSQIQYYVTWALGYVNIFSGIFPVSDLLSAIFTIMTAWVTIYGVKLILWIIGFIPTIGHKELPVSPTNTVDLRPSLKGRNVLNLSGGRKGRNKMRSTRDIR